MTGKTRGADLASRGEGWEGQGQGRGVRARARTGSDGGGGRDLGFHLDR